MRRLAIALCFGWAAVTLAQTPTPTENEHVGYWIKTVQTHPMDLIRKNAARSLGAMGDRTAVPALIQALNDKFFGVRAEAAKSLGLLTDERAVDPLTETATNDSDTQVRRNAREALERLKGYQEYLKKKQEKADKAAEKAEAAKKAN